MTRSEQSASEWAAARDALADALRAGWLVLRQGGSALDAVESAVVVLEDSPHFNAGHGAALNEDGEHELDSSIMRGRDLAAGSVVGVRRIRNPVRAARAVLDAGHVVMLTGGAADRFAAFRGLAMVEPAYFTTPARSASLAAMRRHTAAAATEAERHGTAGAVVHCDDPQTRQPLMVNGRVFGLANQIRAATKSKGTSLSTRAWRTVSSAPPRRARTAGSENPLRGRPCGNRSWSDSNFGT